MKLMSQSEKEGFPTASDFPSFAPVNPGVCPTLLEGAFSVVAGVKTAELLAPEDKFFKDIASLCDFCSNDSRSTWPPSVSVTVYEKRIPFIYFKS